MTGTARRALVDNLPPEFVDRPVVLTAHPLQRVGAFAAAELAGVGHPDDLTAAGLHGVWESLTEALVLVADKDDAKQPGAFWLAVSYMLWPNSKMNTTNRKRLLPGERAQATKDWRCPRNRQEWPGVPCVLCARPACGFYGKVDVPLAASVEYRNTTVPGHAGLALCMGCLASFYALPYGCFVHRGRLSVLHSWDEQFLRDTVAGQVQMTKMQARGTASGLPSGGFEREQLVLEAIWRYRSDRPVDSDVSLLVFTNSNKEQEFTEYQLSQPLVRWLRRTEFNARKRAALRDLEAACTTPKKSGRARLATELLDDPRRLCHTVVGVLRQQAEATRPACVPPITGGLHTLLSTYLIEVMNMSDHYLQEIEQFGARAATLIHEHSQPFTRFVWASRRPGDLRQWVRQQQVAWQTAHNGQKSEPFVTPRLMKLLFDYGDQSWLYRDLFYTATMAELRRRGYGMKSDDVEEAQETIKKPLSDNEEPQQ